LIALTNFRTENV
jgi:hypothetical protein